MLKESRILVFYTDHFSKFYANSPYAVKKKYDYVFQILRKEERVPIKFLKKITNQKNLFEIRVEAESNIFRTFCFFDAENRIIILNSFQKKSQKLPFNKLARAIILKNKYFYEREKDRLDKN